MSWVSYDVWSLNIAYYSRWYDLTFYYMLYHATVYSTILSISWIHDPVSWIGYTRTNVHKLCTYDFQQAFAVYSINPSWQEIRMQMKALGFEAMRAPLKIETTRIVSTAQVWAPEIWQNVGKEAWCLWTTPCTCRFGSKKTNAQCKDFECTDNTTSPFYAGWQHHDLSADQRYGAAENLNFYLNFLEAAAALIFDYEM